MRRALKPSVDVREHVLLEQPDLRYWVVFDQPIFERAPPMAYNWTREQMAEAFGIIDKALEHADKGVRA